MNHHQIENSMNDKKVSLKELALSIVEMDLEAEENQEHLLSLFKTLGEKVENYQWASFYLTKEKETLKEMRDHYDVMIKRCEQADERMSAYIKFVLESVGKKEIRGDNGSRIYTNTYKSVDVFNKELLPAAYKKETKVITANSTQIKEDIIHGHMNIPGARIVENTYGYVTKPKKKMIPK